MTHVSRALRELSRRQIVTCLNPDMVKGRMYNLTDKGRTVFAILKKENERIEERRLFKNFNTNRFYEKLKFTSSNK